MLTSTTLAMTPLRITDMREKDSKIANAYLNNQFMTMIGSPKKALNKFSLQKAKKVKYLPVPKYTEPKRKELFDLSPARVLSPVSVDMFNVDGFATPPPHQINQMLVTQDLKRNSVVEG